MEKCILRENMKLFLTKIKINLPFFEQLFYENALYSLPESPSITYNTSKIKNCTSQDPHIKIRHDSKQKLSKNSFFLKKLVIFSNMVKKSGFSVVLGNEKPCNPTKPLKTPKFSFVDPSLSFFHSIMVIFAIIVPKLGFWPIP